MLLCRANLEAAQRVPKQGGKDAEIENARQQRHHADQRHNDATRAAKAQQAPGDQDKPGYDADYPFSCRSQEFKEALIKRLQRIERQVRGVQAMLSEERDCREIMQQLASIHSAVQSASRIIHQEYATACLVSWMKALNRARVQASTKNVKKESRK